MSVLTANRSTVFPFRYNPAMPRIPELDSLRGLAALAVVLTHAFPETCRGGQLGVDLFFVLSGYLITTIILEDRTQPRFLRDFYTKRVLRIWPVYYLTLAGVLVAGLFTRSGMPSPIAVAQHLTFTQNTPVYFAAEPPPFPLSFSPSWTVAVEEQYYLLWPLFLLAFGPRSVPWLAALFLVANVAGRSLFGVSAGLLFTRGDGLAIGCFLGWLLSRPDSRPVARWLVLVAIPAGGVTLAATAAARWDAADTHLNGSGYVVGASVLFAGLIAACVLWTGRRRLAPLRFAPLAWLGTISYALYLTHLPVFYYLPPALVRLGVPSLLTPPLVWVAVFGVPALSWVCVERRALRLRRRLLPPTGSRTPPGLCYPPSLHPR
jgi:peptidoglycan/LPS O-acetylase OafA/YrhL